MKVKRCPFCIKESLGLSDKQVKEEMIKKDGHYECPQCGYTVKIKKIMK